MTSKSGASLIELRLLQVCIAIGGLVPVGAGLAGALHGSAFVHAQTGLEADSHLRYLSGLLFAIGIAFWSTIPSIETKTGRFRLLTAVVFVGGLARLYGIVVAGSPPPSMLFGLGMELLVTPLLCAWQTRVATFSAGARH